MPDKKIWISGSLPKRGTQSASTAKPAGKAVAKLLRAQQKHRLGMRLAQSMLTTNTPISSRRLVAGVVLISAGLGVGIAGMVSHLLWYLPASSLLLAGGVWAALAAKPATKLVQPSPAQLDDAKQLDALLEQIASQLPAAALDSLLALKALLQQVLSTLQVQADTPVLSMDDRFFVGQVMARYLPDACRQYLAAAQGGADAEASTAEFLTQLTILQAKLLTLRKQLAASQRDKLRQHTTFLRQK